jgi:hypothetical protein
MTYPKTLTYKFTVTVQNYRQEEEIGEELNHLLENILDTEIEIDITEKNEEKETNK